jgi:hypothetical protein
MLWALSMIGGMHKKPRRQPVLLPTKQPTEQMEVNLARDFEEL